MGTVASVGHADEATGRERSLRGVSESRVVRRHVVTAPSIYIALLRAVNAGGVNSLPTRDFVAILNSLGLQSVRTYIQTGNAVFRTRMADAAQLSSRIKLAIERGLGFAPEVVVLSLTEFEHAVAENPFPQADAEPKSLHVAFFAAQLASPDLASLQRLCSASESFALHERAFYFLAPDGVARSKAFARIERSLGVTVTARNWRTVQSLVAIGREVATA